MKENLKYCYSPFCYKRLNTREVFIGKTPMGGNNPIRIQSMTNTNTLDTESSVKQIVSLVNLGAEYVRLTASSIKEAENLRNIKNSLNKKGIFVPLIADIHFKPEAAIIAAQIVEKIRINPGNFHDKKNIKKLYYSDKEYNLELEIIAEKLTPLIKTCNNYGTVIRIGTNHGSLSDRVVEKYGNTALGMVMSTMEYIKIFENKGFKNLVISLKASNVIIMIEAYRLLAKELLLSREIYPLHLGVTEAGNGIEGRVKSAFGIGTLLADGIGDTIRVSLAEKPENEIPVAKKIVSFFEKYTNFNKSKSNDLYYNPFDFKKRLSQKVGFLGSDIKPIYVVNVGENFLNETEYIKEKYNLINGQFIKKDSAPDLIFINGNNDYSNKIKGTYIYNSVIKKNLNSPKKYIIKGELENKIKIVEINENSYSNLEYDKLENTAIVLNFKNIHSARKIINDFIIKEIKIPIIYKIDIDTLDNLDLLIEASIKQGFLLSDGLINGIWINTKNFDLKTISEISLCILQASRQRFSKTEFIICPTCGRTQFDVEKVANQVKMQTQHLKGLKIAVMGCVVNGLGEMADADYGYIGAGKSKVNLYKGKELIKRNITEEEAIDQLIELIKLNGNWQEMS